MSETVECPECGEDFKITALNRYVESDPERGEILCKEYQCDSCDHTWTQTEPLTLTPETILGTASVSKNWQTYIIREARPHLKLERGDDVEFVLRNGRVFIRRAKN